MERLTERDTMNRVAHIKPGECEAAAILAAAQRLAGYEETGLTPDEVSDMVRVIRGHCVYCAHLGTRSDDRSISLTCNLGDIEIMSSRCGKFRYKNEHNENDRADLVAYRSTGLTPEQVTEMLQALKGNCKFCVHGERDGYSGARCGLSYIHGYDEYGICCNWVFRSRKARDSETVLR